MSSSKKKVSLNKNHRSSLPIKQLSSCAKHLDLFKFEAKHFKLNSIPCTNNISMSTFINWMECLTTEDLSSLFTLQIGNSRLTQAIQCYTIHLVTIKGSRINKILWLYDSHINPKSSCLKSIPEDLNYNCCSCCTAVKEYMTSYEVLYLREELRFLSEISVSVDAIDADSKVLCLKPNQQNVQRLLRLIGHPRLASLIKHRCLEETEGIKTSFFNMTISSFGQLIAEDICKNLLNTFHYYKTQGVVLKAAIKNNQENVVKTALGITKNSVITNNRAVLDSIKHVGSEIKNKSVNFLNAILETSYRRDNISKAFVSTIRSNLYINQLWLLSYIASASHFNVGLESLLRIPIIECLTPINEFKSLMISKLLVIGSDKIAVELAASEEIRLSQDAKLNELKKLKNKKKKKKNKQKSKIVQNATIASELSFNGDNDSCDGSYELKMEYEEVLSANLGRPGYSIQVENNCSIEKNEVCDDIITSLEFVFNDTEAEVHESDINRMNDEFSRQNAFHNHENFNIFEEAYGQSVMRHESQQFVPGHLQSQTNNKYFSEFNLNHWQELNNLPIEDSYSMNDLYVPYENDLFSNSGINHTSAERIVMNSDIDLKFTAASSQRTPCLEEKTIHVIQIGQSEIAIDNTSTIPEMKVGDVEFSNNQQDIILGLPKQFSTEEIQINNYDNNNNINSSINLTTEDQISNLESSGKSSVTLNKRNSSGLSMPLHQTHVHVPSLESVVQHQSNQILKLEAKHLLSEISRSVLVNKLAIYKNVIQDLVLTKDIQHQHFLNASTIPAHRHHVFPHANVFASTIQNSLPIPVKHYHDDNVRAYQLLAGPEIQFSSMLAFQQYQNRSVPVSGQTTSTLSSYVAASSTPTPAVQNLQSFHHLSDAVSEDGDRHETITRTRNASVGQADGKGIFSSGIRDLSVRALLPLKPLGTQQHVSVSVSNNQNTAKSITINNENELLDGDEGETENILTKTTLNIRSNLSPTNYDQRTESPSIGHSTHKNSNYSTAFLLENYLQSGLSKEIANFVELIDNNELKLRKAKNDSFNRLRVIAKGLWPRSQVKIFGSYMSGLSLPSSDLDLVICLPKVHVEAATDAPGVLEGRNAIKETWQQNLLRCLCNEDWVQAESIKVIGNTAIPVLKLKTKSRDTAPSISLDISFEGPGHKGLEANKLISSVIKKYAPIRPLVLILKYFLSKRRLCEAYTGGLSSYAVFLLTTRFLQELEVIQSPTLNGSDSSCELQVMDLGALLIGLLRFYGDFFDPRSTGLSVLRRCYFPRSAALPDIRAQQYPFISTPGNMIPGVVLHQSPPLATRPISNSSDRRHSLNAGRFPTSLSMNSSSSFEPYRFDPVCIEDPLEAGNNVGRNCFRINQVQRCLSEVATAVDSHFKDICNANLSNASISGNNLANQSKFTVENINHLNEKSTLRIILGQDYDKL